MSRDQDMEIVQHTALVPSELLSRVQQAVQENRNSIVMFGLQPAEFIILATTAHTGKLVGKADGNALKVLDIVLAGMIVQAGNVDPALREFLEFTFTAQQNLADSLDEMRAEEKSLREDGWLKRLVERVLRWLW